MDKDTFTAQTKPSSSHPSRFPQRRKYIVCGYHDYPGASQVLSSTLGSNNYLVGNRVKDFTALNQVGVGDILLLSYERKIVAYGEATSGLTALSSSESNRPYYEYEIKVKKWIRFDGQDPSAGIRNGGIMKNCTFPQNIRAIAKEVTSHFAQPFIDKIDMRQPQ